MTTIRTEAIAAIRSYSEAKQAELDAASLAASAALVSAYRELATEGIDPTSPVYPVAALVAQSLVFGREDGFPDVSIPPETKTVLLAALGACLLRSQGAYVNVGGLQFYNDFSGLSRKPDPWEAAYQTWNAASIYRRNQTWKSL